MRDVSSVLQHAVGESAAALRSLGELDQQLRIAVDLIEECLASGRKLLVCGNGGSAADAAHFATELVVRFSGERRGYPAISLTSDAGLLSAAGNDYGFAEVFARQVAAFGLSGDLLICLTTSGNSPNVQRALAVAKELGLKSIAFLGRDGGETKGMADVELVVRSDVTARIQEMHMLLLHVICEALDSRWIPAK